MLHIPTDGCGGCSVNSYILNQHNQVTVIFMYYHDVLDTGKRATFESQLYVLMMQVHVTSRAGGTPAGARTKREAQPHRTT